jgi:hypothetical protein
MTTDWIAAARLILAALTAADDDQVSAHPLKWWMRGNVCTAGRCRRV